MSRPTPPPAPPPAEEAFFAAPGEAAPGPTAPGEVAPPPPRPRRESPLLARSPIFATLAVLVSGWLLWELSADVAYVLSARDPIDLGGPGAYALDRARENRLVQVRGELGDAVPVTVARTGQQRTVGRVAGTNLLVDRPGRGGPPVYEGRLLPAAARADYAEVAAALKARGAPLEDRWLVLRDGERPRERWLPVLGAAVLLLVLAVNLRALVKALAR
ncbi:MAG: hypothetical protein IPO09_16295 [Anaeromyxobacter sp.]|nr:hypothetical protein [Anaeromyxobacter sp.]MBL0276081.1 hypothetical protein [Anaeromyxobacter sp.]